MTITNRQSGGRKANLIAIDPGNQESAVACFDEDGKFILSQKLPNAEVLRILRNKGEGARFTTKDGRYYAPVAANHIAVEMVACYGMAVGAEVFETCVMVGRILEAAGLPHTLVYRRDVKIFLCNSMKAKDSNIRQRIIDLYGGKDRAIGNKKNPGVLWGVSKDQWAAIGVGLTWRGIDFGKLTEVNNGK